MRRPRRLKGTGDSRDENDLCFNICNGCNRTQAQLIGVVAAYLDDVSRRFWYGKISYVLKFGSLSDVPFFNTATPSPSPSPFIHTRDVVKLHLYIFTGLAPFVEITRVKRHLFKQAKLIAKPGTTGQRTNLMANANKRHCFLLLLCWPWG